MENVLSALGKVFRLSNPTAASFSTYDEIPLETIVIVKDTFAAKPIVSATPPTPEEAKASKAVRPGLGSPRESFSTVAESNPSAPTKDEEVLATGLYDLTAAKDGQGLKMFYYRHPATGMLLAAQMPLQNANDQPLDHQQIARSLLTKTMPKPAAQQLLRACATRSTDGNAPIVWGGTRLIAQVGGTTAHPKLLLSGSGKYGHPSADEELNEAIATFYANVCIMTHHAADVESGEPSTEALATRVREKIRAAFPNANE